MLISRAHRLMASRSEVYNREAAVAEGSNGIGNRFCIPYGSIGNPGVICASWGIHTTKDCRRKLPDREYREPLAIRATMANHRGHRLNKVIQREWIRGEKCRDTAHFSEFLEEWRHSSLMGNHAQSVTTRSLRREGLPGH